MPAGYKEFNLYVLLFEDQDNNLVKYFSPKICWKTSANVVWNLVVASSSDEVLKHFVVLYCQQFNVYVLPIFAATALTNLWIANRN